MPLLEKKTSIGRCSINRCRYILHPEQSFILGLYANLIRHILRIKARIEQLKFYISLQAFIQVRTVFLPISCAYAKQFECINKM